MPGAGSLASRFAFYVVDGLGMQFPAGYILVGTPKAPIAGGSRMLFYVEATSSQVRRVLVIDENGNRNRLDFQNTVISLRP